MDELKMVSVVSSPTLKGDVILISSYMASVFGLVNQTSLTVYVGQYNRKLELRIGKSTKEEYYLRLSPQLIRRMYLRSGRKYGFMCKGAEIHLGPTVGIMAETYNESGRPFGGQSYFIKQLLQAGSKFGQICFAFSPYSIDWKKRVIYGYRYVKSGWRRARYPIPDVVYPREKAYSFSKLSVRNRLKTRGVQFINPPLIGKWRTYQVITQNPKLVSHIPETKLLNNSRQLSRMINKHRAVYLKPVAGSQGKNIIRVRKKGKAQYHYQYQMNQQQRSGNAGSIPGLRSSLRRVMGNRRYIVQKQINLLRLQGKILDVRVLAQRGSDGEWGVTGMACRVGRTGSITSNISTGGNGRKIDTVLRRNFSDETQRQEILESVRYVAIEAAKTLETYIGRAGEMGIDIGIDRQGKVWFIEANLRPARQVFTLIGEKRVRRQSVETPMLYARHLAGF